MGLDIMQCQSTRVVTNFVVGDIELVVGHAGSGGCCAWGHNYTGGKCSGRAGEPGYRQLGSSSEN
jgi:hypothetical protein